MDASLPTTTVASSAKAERRGGSRSKSHTFSQSSVTATLLLAFLSCVAWLYVVGRLWQDAESRTLLSNLLQKNLAQRPKVLSVEDKLMIYGCKHLQKKIVEVEMELTLAKSQGYLLNQEKRNDKLLAVIGVYTGFGSRLKRNIFRGSWMPKVSFYKAFFNNMFMWYAISSYALSPLPWIDMSVQYMLDAGHSLILNMVSINVYAGFVALPAHLLVLLLLYLRKEFLDGDKLAMLEEKGVVIRFVIGRSPNRGDSLDRNIDVENQKTKDFLILESHEEAEEEIPKKTKSFFTTAVQNWDAEFYVKVDDSIDLDLDLDGLITLLEKRRGQESGYIGCMKSGDVVTEEYFRHAGGSLIILSKSLADYIFVNSASLKTYAYDDTSIGSWMIGLQATYIDDTQLCCSSSTQDKVCSLA